MPVIQIDNLQKSYGDVQALGGVSLHVEKGEIFGLLGRNGAGKTTMVKILLGIAKLSNGRAELLGQPAGTVSVRRQVGYLPEDHRFPDYHTAWSMLHFYGMLVGVSRNERNRRIPEMLELVGIAHRMKYKVRTYSKGMKQRLGIAQALMHDPEVLFLDEPTDGVDPVGRREIRAVLQRLKDRGRTIFLNSHLLSEVEMVTDRVAIMEQGRLLREGTIEALTREKDRFVIGVAPDQQMPVEEIQAQGYRIEKGKESLVEVILEEGQSIDPVVDLIRGRGLSLHHLVEKRSTLEDIFIAALDSEPVTI